MPEATVGLDVTLTERELAGLAALADAHAVELWGDNIGRGYPLPVAGATGAVKAYAFPFVIGGRVFPDLSPAALAHSRARFATVFVASGEVEHPIVRTLHGLHPAFTRLTDAHRVARRMLGESAQIVRFYSDGPHQDYFEGVAGERRILLDAHTLRPIEPGMAFRECPAVPRGFMHKFEPPVLPRPPFVEPVLKMVPYPDCVPMVGWTWWCVPTAFTIATCYYDNFVPGVVGTVGFGRLVGYWFDHPKFGTNVPDFIDQLIDPATGNWRTGFAGFSDFIQQTYGYTFATREVAAGSNNDWAWSDIVAEVDAGRPFVWAVPGHDTCGFGYRVKMSGAKYVVLNTTWGYTDEWLHTEGTGLGAIIPGGATVGQDVALWKPDGGESIAANKPFTIQWYVWGKEIVTAEIMFSSDGGNTWVTEVKAVPCVPGLNVYDWTPTVPTSKARLRIRCSDAAGTYIAGDGSHHNFVVTP